MEQVIKENYEDFSLDEQDFIYSSFDCVKIGSDYNFDQFIERCLNKRFVETSKQIFTDLELLYFLSKNKYVEKVHKGVKKYDSLIDYLSSNGFEMEIIDKEDNPLYKDKQGLSAGDSYMFIRENPPPKLFGRQFTEVILIDRVKEITKKGIETYVTLEYSLFPFRNSNGGLFGNTLGGVEEFDRRKRELREIRLEERNYTCELTKQNQIKSLSIKNM